jgi:signal transduction histidine kinase/ligand-binding sensor domain-containing protein
MSGIQRHGNRVGLAAALLMASSCLLAQRAGYGARIRLPIEDGTDLVFLRVPFSNGSAHTTVSQIAKDQLGFLWFGTNNGLKRFDGYRFRDFQPEPGNPYTLSGRGLSPLFNDRSGKLWVASNLTVVRYDPVTESFAHYSSDPSLLEGPIQEIYQDRAGAIWLPTPYGLTRIDPVTGEKTRYVGQLTNTLRSTFEENDGTFWVTDKESVEVFDRRTGEITQRLQLRDSAARESGRSTNVSVHLVEDHAGVLWVASERDGLAKVDRRGNRLTYFALAPGAKPDLEPGASALLEDRQGVLWIGTKSGLFRLDRDRKRFVRYRNNPDDPNSLSADYVSALFEDQESGIWVGTERGGVVRFSSQPMFHRYLKQPATSHDTRSDYVCSAYQDSRGNLWVGGKGIVSRIDQETGRVISYRLGGAGGEFSNADVFSILEDGTGKVWLAAWGGGLHRLDPRTEAWKTYRHKPDDPSSLGQDSVFALFIDHRGRLWAGTENGLNAFDSKTERFQVYRIPALGNNRVRAIAEDSRGALWLATLFTGVHRFDPDTGTFTVYRHSEGAGSLSNDAVMAICVDHSGKVWAGTADGLNRFDPETGRFAVYYERDGLAGNSVTGIQEDDQSNLWATTNNGLSRLDRRANTFQNYYQSNGIPSDLTSVWRSPTGEMFVGSASGLIGFFPKRLIRTQYVPPVVLTGFQLNDIPAPIGGDSPLKLSISVTRSLILPHKWRTFAFEFVALSYASPAETGYRYKLEGLDSEWNEVDATQRVARYTTLAPANYVFHVQSRTGRGAWNEDGSSVRIVILPPWWSTWWFRTAGALVIASVVWLVYRLRVGQMTRQLDLRFQERLRERTRIAQDLHDTLLQNIVGLCLQIGGLSKVVTGESEKDRLQGIRRQGEECLREARQAVWDLRSLESESLDLATELRESGERLSAGKVARFNFIVDGEPRRIPLHLREHLLRIGREAISNAVRHAQAEQIEVWLTFEKDAIQLRISDNGRGFNIDDASALPGHFGLVTMRERAEQIRASIVISSEVRRGTRIEVTVPGAI